MSASTIERDEGCPVSSSLPQITKNSAWAARGTRLHAFIAARLNNRPMVEALEHVEDEEKDTARGVDLHRLVGDLAVVRTEVSYAIDVRDRTVRELGRNIDRRYDEAAAALGKPLGLYEIPGTIDLEGRTRLGVELAGDLKTGFRSVVPAADHRQLHWEVTARYLAAEASAVEGRIFKIREGGEVEIDSHLFGGMALDTIGDELFEIQQGVIAARNAYQDGGEIVVSPGHWCEHCPAFLVCPAQTELARAVTVEAGAVVARLTSMTREQEWEAIVQWKQGEKVLEAIGAIMKGRAVERMMMNDPITSPDGSKYFAPVKGTRSAFSQAHALALLRHLGATEDQIRALFIAHPTESWRMLNVPGAKKPKLTAKRKKEIEAEKATELAAKEEAPLLVAHNPGAAMREKANES
jgi:hypothetical protein